VKAGGWQRVKSCQRILKRIQRIEGVGWIANPPYILNPLTAIHHPC
jgi:hypothetical protein